MSASRFTYSVIAISVILTLVAAYVFLSNPWIDLALERIFYNPETGFLLNEYWLIGRLRKAVIFSYSGWYAAIAIFAIVTFRNSSRPLRKNMGRQNKGWKNTGIGFRQWLYLAIASITGPLLITNIILKNNWGRARPRQLQEFGGSLDFSPPLQISDQCQTNCSFVSGEPSSMFMIFISLAFVVPAKRNLLVTLAITMGTLSGLMRMGQGGHFFSDVVFAGLFMALAAAIVYWAMFLSPLASKRV